MTSKMIYDYLPTSIINRANFITLDGIVVKNRYERTCGTMHTWNSEHVAIHFPDGTVVCLPGKKLPAFGA